MDCKSIYLYVERLEKRNRTLLLDFVYEHDYSSVINSPGLDLNVEVLSRYFVKPSMIMINNFSTSVSVREGSILAMNRERFMHMIFEEGHIVRNTDETTEPSQILLIVGNGIHFAEMIESKDVEVVSQTDSFSEDSFVDLFGRVCDSSSDDDSFRSEMSFFSSFDNSDSSMVVWDVGQGNANGIYNDTSVLLFDFGAPIYAPIHRTLQYYTSIVSSLQNKSYALILSHWDLDHYKMLCYAPDDFFEKIEFIVFPTRIISFTAKQVVQRLSKLCGRKCIPVIPTAPRNGSFKLIMWNGPFHLYVGNSRMNINNSGLFLIVSGSKSYGMFTGDRTNWNPKHMQYLWWPGRNQKMNIVVPHHGGDSNTIPDYKTITYPHIAAISVGSNTYSHPTLKTISRYTSRGYRIARTDYCGDIVIPLGKL